MQTLGTIMYKLKARDIRVKRQLHPSLNSGNVWLLGSYLKADPLQLLAEERLFCSHSHIC